MEKNKLIGLGFSIIASIFCVVFALQTDLEIGLKSYLSLDYLMQLTPLIISVMLLAGGVFLIIKHAHAIPALALFGFTALEDIIFNWFGITTSYLPIYAIVVFFCCALIALWIVYSNMFDIKRLSVKEGALALIFGTAVNLLPSFL